MDEEAYRQGMRPRDSAEMNAEPTGDAGLTLQHAIEEPRANLIADVVGHPKGAPSVVELNHMNPSLDEAAIRRHLDVLQEAGIVRLLEVDAGDRANNCPETL
jgi:DNA-binding transcriptional ArsR family regulator